MDFILQLVNTTPYVWWKDGESTTDEVAPFYCHHVPDVLTIQRLGCNCAGLINIIQQRCKSQTVPGSGRYAGGTEAWYEYLKGCGVLEPFDSTKSYPVGSLLLRQYRDPVDQGHLALLYVDGQLLHCYPVAGITIDASVKRSHDCIHYEFVCVGWLYRIGF